MATMYDQFSEYYDKLGVSEYSLKLGNGFLQYLKDYFPNETMKKHLDVCCGTGTLCAFMNEHGIETFGYDLSSGMIEKARENYPGLSFAVADAANFSDGKIYDFATCTDDAINHMTDPEIVKNAFKTTANELRTGGIFFFDLNIIDRLTFDAPYVKGLSENEVLSYLVKRTSDSTLMVEVQHKINGVADWVDYVHERMYTTEEIKCFLSEAGMELLECRNEFYEATRPIKNIYIARKL